jgi:hypothetical protein
MPAILFAHTHREMFSDVIDHAATMASERDHVLNLFLEAMTIQTPTEFIERINDLIQFWTADS